MRIQQHHPIPSSPTFSLRIMMMMIIIMYMHSKYMRWWHYCHFTEGSQGLEELACPHSLPPPSQSLA